MASLALALGLADAVREEAGGFDLQTLFVDEGFGTLDDESLEQVMAVLDGLREGGRGVGVVSHVASCAAASPPSSCVVKTRERLQPVRCPLSAAAEPAAEPAPRRLRAALASAPRPWRYARRVPGLHPEGYAGHWRVVAALTGRYSSNASGGGQAHTRLRSP